jgi:hypothetical protein
MVVEVGYSYLVTCVWYVRSTCKRIFGQKTEVDLTTRLYTENLHLSLNANVNVTVFKKYVICLELVDLHMCCIYFPLFSVDYTFIYTNDMFIRIVH